MKWTDERCEQLQTLREVLWLANGLNHSSGTAQNIMKLAEKTERLIRANMDVPTPSFLSFLNDLAVEDRLESAKHHNPPFILQNGKVRAP